MDETISTQRYHSPCGELTLGDFHGRLCLCNWADAPETTARVARRLNANTVEQPTQLTAEAARQLDEYFQHKRRSFELPLLLVGTEFQKRVWQVLQQIPYGTTITYAEQARRLREPTAVRAAATANKANAVSIIVPCHRVIGSNGNLTGYGGGIETKAALIKHEGNLLI